MTDEDKMILRSSKRRYQNISFDTDNKDFFIEFLADRAGSWKFVYMNSLHTDDESTLHHVFDIISPSVEKLEIIKMNAKNLQVVHYWTRSKKIVRGGGTKWTFPMLKSLKCCKSSDPYNYFKHFESCSTLTEFELFTFDQGPNLNREVLPLLRNNPRLQELDVMANNWTLIEHSQDYQFKLRKLSLNCDGGSADLLPHLYHFLETQAETLESLKIEFADVTLDQAFFELILIMMPRLTSLAVSLWRINEVILNWQGAFPVNETITTLDLNSRKEDEQLLSYQTLVRAMPKCHVI